MSRNLFDRYLKVTIMVLYALVGNALTGKYPIQNFSPEEYQAGNQNIDFAQNRDMDLFVANNLGVLSYNGIEWERHAFRSGKKKRSLAFDGASGKLFVGSQGEFGYFEEDWSYVSLLELIPTAFRDFDEVWDVFIINSNVYFCTFQGLYIYDGKAISVLGLEEGLNRSFRVGRKLYTQNQNGVLFEIEHNQLTGGFRQEQYNDIIVGIIAEEEGLLLVYNSGAIEWSNPFDVEERYGQLAKALEGTYVNHVLQLSDTRLVISTQTSGLFLYDRQKDAIERISTDDGLLTNACLRSFQDHAGNLWVGMQNGIALIHINSPLRLINQEISIQGSGYEVYDTPEGTYYTTSNGIYFQRNRDGQSVFLVGTEGPGYGMQMIAGKLYAGHHTGLFLLERGRAQRIATTDGLWQIKPLVSKPNRAIGGTYSGLYLFEITLNGRLRPLQKLDGFEESSRFFEEDQNGEIWVGQYYKGLYRLKLNTEMTAVTVNRAVNRGNLPIEEQVVLTKFENQLFIATNDGLYQIDQVSGEVTEGGYFSDFIGNQPVYLIVQDKLKNIHIVAENILGFFKKISNTSFVFVPSSLFHLRYHFNNDLLNVSINVENGIMYSSNEGFIHYNPELEDHISAEKPILIKQVFSVTQERTLYARRPFDIRPEDIAELVVPQKDKVLQFEVESFQFNEVKNKQFRYFLKGFDNEYSVWTNSSSKEYTNLTEGKYEFSVQSRNYLGEITTSTPFLLRVKPPFYRTIFAKAFYMFLGVFILSMIFRMQNKNYKQKTLAVAEAKDLELAVKQQELVKIEEENEQELLRMKEDKMKSELQHVSNLLAASTMNLVVKNEFIENIKEKLKEVKRKGKNEDTKQALEQIVRKIDKELRLQEDWEQFEYHFDQVHGDFLNRLRDEFLQLTPNEQKLCTLLRLNLNTKEIANLMSISLRGVEVGRYRLRKKLNLARGANLSKFILEY